MMKKISLLLLFSMCYCVSMQADDRNIPPSKLPASVHSFVKKYYPQVQILRATQDTDYDDREYKVYLSDGSEIEFTPKGEWKELEAHHHRSVPAAIIPAEISKYVDKNYRGCKVKKIKKARYGYEIELDNDLEIEFDRRYNVIDIDD